MSRTGQNSPVLGFFYVDPLHDKGLCWVLKILKPNTGYFYGQNKVKISISSI